MSAGNNTQSIRIGVYCRVSAHHKDLESKITVFREYIGDHPDWVMVGFYADTGHPGGASVLEQSEFQRMMKDCEAHKLDAILTESIDQLSREKLDGLNIISQLKSLGIGIVLIKEGINTLDDTGASFLSALASIIRQESRLIVHGVRLDHSHQKKHHSKNSESLYSTDAAKPPIEASIVSRIFRDFLDGLTAPEIRALLEKDGIQCPGGQSKWYPSTVESILQNKRYQEGAIVPTVVFQTTQHELRRRQATLDTSGKRTYTSKYIFSKVTRCSLCGAPYRRGTSESGARWACSKGHRRWTSVDEVELQDCVVQAFKDLPAAKGALPKIARQAHAGELSMLLARLGELENRQAEINQQLSQGQQTDEQSIMALKAELDRLEIRYIDLQTTIAEKSVQKIQAISMLDLLDSLKVPSTPARHFAADSDLDEFIRRTSKLYAPDVLDRFDDDLTRRFVDKITVSKDCVSVHFKVGVELTV